MDKELVPSVIRLAEEEMRLSVITPSLRDYKIKFSDLFPRK